VAGGQGSRFGGDIPKQFLPLGDMPVIGHSLVAFEQNIHIDQIVLVVPVDYFDFCTDMVKKLGVSKLKRMVVAGEFRHDSVYNGLLGLNYTGEEPALVLVHDAARPFVKGERIDMLLMASSLYGAATLGLPVTDTIKEVDKGRFTIVERTLLREKLYAVQTPQAFYLDKLMTAHEMAQKERYLGHDDCELMEAIGFKPHILIGCPTNIKITHNIDMALAKIILDQEAKP